jgi:hypothetical protein
MIRRKVSMVRAAIATAAVAALPEAAAAGDPYVGKEPPPDALLFGGRCTIVGREKAAPDRWSIYAACDGDRMFKTQLVHLENDKWVLERSTENLSIVEKN